MTTTIRYRIRRTAFIALSIAACTLCAVTAPAAERVFTVKGEVLALDAANLTATIAHEDIPGFMPAMTMPFTVDSAETIQALATGDVVVFEFVVGRKASRARAFRILERPDGPSASVATPPSPLDRIGRLEPGSRVPELTLTNQAGNVTALADPARHTVLTFIFTRCPVPEFCPLLMQKFQRLQRTLSEDSRLAGSVRLLGITLDPAFDSVDILHDYGEAFGAEPGSWELARLPEAELAGLTRAFRVYREFNGVTLDHGLVTAWIDPGGRVREIWRGNSWTVEEVARALQGIRLP